MEQLKTTMGNVTYNDWGSTGLMYADAGVASHAMYVGSVPQVEKWEPAYVKDMRRMAEEETDTQKKKPVLLKKENGKMAKPKRGLYQVILIDPKEGKILSNKLIISGSVDDVLLESNAGEDIKKSGLKVANVDKIVNFLGPIRKTKKNKEGVVEILNEEE